MDGHRFDRLARELVASQNRRQVLWALGASALAAILSRSAFAQDAGCPEGCPAEQACLDGRCVAKCLVDADCPEDGDADACTAARCQDGICTALVVDCAEGFECCGNGECCPVGCQTDADCPSDDDPCTAATCNPDGTCSTSTLDCAEGYVCCGNGSCCPRPCDGDNDCNLSDPCAIGRCGTETAGVCAYTRHDRCYPCTDDPTCAAYRLEFGPAVCCNGICVGPCAPGEAYGRDCLCVPVPVDGALPTDVADADGSDGPGGDRGDEAPAGTPVA